MPVCKLLFKVPPHTTVDMEDLKDDVLDLVSLWRRNGQISSEGGVCIINDNEVYMDVICPEVNSLDNGNNNIYINNLIEKMKECHHVSFSYVTIDGINSSNGASAYANADFFILHWRYYSPLISGNNFEPIPLYYFPYSYHDQHSYNDISSWQNNYGRVYELWMSGEIDEPVFYNYLSNIDSSLNRQGLKVCRNLEHLIAKPVYYYLFYYGEDPQQSDCPSCGKNWKLEVPLFNEFHFKCDHCKIISNDQPK